MIPFIIPAIVSASIALIATFTTTALLAGVAAISSPFFITVGLGAVATLCTSVLLTAGIAVSFFLAGVVAICTPLMLMAGFAVSVIVASVTAICSASLIVAGLAASHFLGFVNLAPAFLGLTSIATKLTFPVVARAARIGASVTAALAQSLRVKKLSEQDRPRRIASGEHRQ